MIKLIFSILSIAAPIALYNGNGYRVGDSSTPILLDNVRCDGTESRLVDCTASTPDFLCSHSDDAGVRCRDPNFVCIHGDIRLA